MLDIKSGVFGYKKKTTKKIVLDGITLQLQPGELMCILAVSYTHLDVYKRQTQF